MLIAILSDIHDHLWRLRRALQRIGAADAEALLCCGDLCSPFVVAELARGFARGPIHLVFGNNDGDRYRITTVAGQEGAPRVRVHGESAALELGGKRIFLHHFNDVGALVAAAGEFDLVCYGHNHEWTARRHSSGAIELNPGAIMGWHPTRGDIASTFALYDTERHRVEIVDSESGAVLVAVG
jgi:putative phosphoesterase